MFSEKTLTILAQCASNGRTKGDTSLADFYTQCFYCGNSGICQKRIKNRKYIPQPQSTRNKQKCTKEIRDNCQHYQKKD